MKEQAYRELNFDQEEQRGLFGEDKADRALPSSGMHEFMLVWRSDRGLSIAVSDPLAGAGEKWIFLPKSQISYTRYGKATVNVHMPEWLAREKGLL